MKRIILLILISLFVCPKAYAGIREVGEGATVESVNDITYLMNGKTSTGDGEIFTVHPLNRTIDAKVVGTGAVTATVIIYVSNTGASNDWIVAGTITLSGTTSDVDGFTMRAKWGYMKANVSSISGTGAAVTVTMGV